MRFFEVALVEPDKNVVALADAYFFPPFQPSLLPKTKGGPVIPSKLPPRKARLVVYNKKSNETSIWIVQLSEVHAATRGGHHRGKVVWSKVVPDVQPPMVYHVLLYFSLKVWLRIPSWLLRFSICLKCKLKIISVAIHLYGTVNGST